MSNPVDPPPVYTEKDVEKNAFDFEGKEINKRDPPPSYFSITKDLQKAKEESSGNAQFGLKFMGIVCGSMLCTICMGIFLALPIAMIVMGAIYLDDCPAERLIPIFLIVQGSFGCFAFVLSIVKNVTSKKKDDDEDEQKKPPACVTCIDSLVQTFMTVWFICGNVWVYSTKDDFVRSPVTSNNYCNPTLFYFAFWVITVTYIMVGVAIMLCCSCFIFCACFAAKNRGKC